MSKNLLPGTMPNVEGNPLPTIAQDLFGDGTMLVVPLPGYTIVHMGLLVRGQRVGLEIGDWCLYTGDAAWSSDAYRPARSPLPATCIMLASLSASLARHMLTITRYMQRGLG